MPYITPGLGTEIARLRTEKGWTQGQLAQMLGYSSPGTVTQWEKGWNDPSAAALYRLNRLFGSNLVLAPTARSLKREGPSGSSESSSAGVSHSIKLTVHNFVDGRPFEIEKIVSNEVLAKMIALTLID